MGHGASSVWTELTASRGATAIPPLAGRDGRCTCLLNSRVLACRFPPLGERSVAGAGPLQGYRQAPLGEVNKQGNAATTLIAMLETPEGIANADAIAALAGIDVLLIGSNDLCTAMGIPGELKNPKLRAAYEATAKACKRTAKFSVSAEFVPMSTMLPN